MIRRGLCIRESSSQVRAFRCYTLRTLNAEFGTLLFGPALVFDLDGTVRVLDKPGPVLDRKRLRIGAFTSTKPLHGTQCPTRLIELLRRGCQCRRYTSMHGYQVPLTFSEPYDEHAHHSRITLGKCHA